MVDRIAHLEMMASLLLDEIRKLKPKETKPLNRKKEIELRTKQKWLTNQKLSK